MTTFALVHGAWLGAWCFERLTQALETLGHRVVAVDLPSDDPTATFQTYADVVVAALDGDAEEPVVVGHSLAGLTVPLIATRRPVQKIVYLCALVPIPGRSFVEQRDVEPDMLYPDYLDGMGEVDANGLRRWVDKELPRQILYADCDAEAASAAIERLRPQAQTPYGEACVLDTLPSTPSTYIVCGEDRLVNPDWSRRIAKERLGADLVELPGSHSPFLSRPNELAAVLHDR